MNGILNVQNGANEIISQLNAHIVSERITMVDMQQEQIKMLEEKFQINKNKLIESIKNVEEREDLWEQRKDRSS